jgi:hypothetical protein
MKHTQIPIVIPNAQALIAVVAPLRLSAQLNARIALRHRIREAVALVSGVRNT